MYLISAALFCNIKGNKASEIVTSVNKNLSKTNL